MKRQYSKLNINDFTVLILCMAGKAWHGMAQHRTTWRGSQAHHLPPFAKILNE